jgi:hypothetical protein
MVIDQAGLFLSAVFSSAIDKIQAGQAWSGW